MSVEIREIERLKQKITDTQAEVERAKGALAECMRILKRDFKVDSVEDGKVLLKRMQVQEEKMAGELQEKIDEFESKYADVLS